MRRIRYRTNGGSVRVRATKTRSGGSSNTTAFLVDIRPAEQGQRKGGIWGIADHRAQRARVEICGHRGQVRSESDCVLSRRMHVQVGLDKWW